MQSLLALWLYQSFQISVTTAAAILFWSGVCQQGRVGRVSPEKTAITHVTEGFDFLGQNVRRYPSGKLLIKPARKSIKSLLTRVKEIVRKHLGDTAHRLVTRLCARPRIAVSSRWPAMTRTPSSSLPTMVSGAAVSRNATWCLRHAAKTRSRASRISGG